MEQAKYKVGDPVGFELAGRCWYGVIAIVDARGTFDQTEEPSYDILIAIDGERCLCKHIRQSKVWGAGEVAPADRRDEHENTCL